MGIIKVCKYCKKSFVTDAMSSKYCSDKCRDDSRREYMEQFNAQRYGGVSKAPSINFETWESRYDKADTITKFSLLQDSGYSYGQISEIYRTNPKKYEQIYQQVLEEKRRKESVIIERIQAKNDEIAERCEREVGWKRELVPTDLRHGDERCRECKWLNQDVQDDKWRSRCDCPGFEKKRYIYPAQRVCVRGFCKK